MVTTQIRRSVDRPPSNDEHCGAPNGFQQPYVLRLSRRLRITLDILALLVILVLWVFGPTTQG
jgi:hypothetical protein